MEKQKNNTQTVNSNFDFLKLIELPVNKTLEDKKKKNNIEMPENQMENQLTTKNQNGKKSQSIDKIKEHITAALLIESSATGWNANSLFKVRKAHTNLYFYADFCGNSRVDGVYDNPPNCH